MKSSLSIRGLMSIICNNMMKTLTLICRSLCWRPHSCYLNSITPASLNLYICIFILIISRFCSCWSVFPILRHSSFLYSCCIKLSFGCFSIRYSLMWIQYLPLTLLVKLVMMWWHNWAFIQLISLYLNIIIFVNKLSCTRNYLWEICSSILFQCLLSW